MGIEDIKKDLISLAQTEQVEEKFKYFHKTEKGGYAQNDVFIGITVPNIRKVIKNYYSEINLKEVEQLLHHEYHEYRLAALLILTLKMKKANVKERKEIAELYLKNTKYINGWDLVDLSAHYVLGVYLIDNFKERKILYKLANSCDLWKKRIAIVSTWIFIKKGEYNDTLEIAKILLDDTEDLIHKAVRMDVKRNREKRF